MAITLKAARVNSGMTQEEAAKQLGLKSVETLRKYERGETYPTVPVIKKMLEAYGVKFDDLIF